MKPLVIVTGKHSEEGLRRFRDLPGCRVVTAESPEDLRPDDLAEAELFAGWVTPELVRKMPRLRFVQLFSAGPTVSAGFRRGSSWPTRTALTGIPSRSTC